jgi:predicted TIM-barrel fold metal-dependent hydrolase
MIALEEHLLPKDVVAAIGVDPASLLGKSDALDDLGEERLQSMDAAGIDVQVLSAVAHAVQELDPDQALAVSQDLNDRMAAAVAAHPGRFRAFATLPMCDPKASAAVRRYSSAIRCLRSPAVQPVTGTALSAAQARTRRANRPASRIR